MGHHKHKTSALPDALDLEAIQHESAQLPLISPNRLSRELGLRKNSSNGVASSSASVESLIPAGRGASGIAMQTAPGGALFHVKGRCVRAWLTSAGISIVPASAPWWPPWAALRRVPAAVCYDEVLSASVEHSRDCGILTWRRHHLIICTFHRSRRKRCQWKLQRLILKASDPDLVQEWALRVSEALKELGHRPHNLLVFLNPFSGARRARHVWHRRAAPILESTGARCTVVETERGGHAREVVLSLSLAELQSYDGIVAVGGDGVFQEVLNGILAVRRAGGRAGELAAHMRLGHIPAGSTDAVACSLNGTRCQATAALHIALGDRMGLDVMRVDTANGEHRFAVCVASYGYMGDLMATSEKLRCLGPARYGLAGACTLLRGRAYDAQVSYLPCLNAASEDSPLKECRSECTVCCSPAVSPTRVVGDGAPFMSSSRRALEEPGWVRMQNRYKSIMAVVTACRSDMSTRGLAPGGHLCDGRLHLVLVRSVSRLHFLRFLASIPGSGVQRGRFHFVDVVECSAVQVSPLGPESRWNVDGELLPDNRITARVHHGLVDVFARGVE